MERRAVVFYLGKCTYILYYIIITHLFHCLLFADNGFIELTDFLSNVFAKIHQTNLPLGVEIELRHIG